MLPVRRSSTCSLACQRLLVFSLIALLLVTGTLTAGCTTTRHGKKVGTKTLERKTVATGTYAVRILPRRESRGLERGALHLQVQRERHRQIVYTNQHREIRNREGEPWVLAMLGSTVVVSLGFAHVPPCVHEEEGIDACTTDAEKKAHRRSVIWGLAGATMLGASFLGLVWSLEDENGAHTGNTITHGRMTRTENAPPAPVAGEPVTVRINNQRKRYTTDSQGRITLRPARDFGLQSAETPRPVMASVILPDRRATQSVALPPERWMRPTLRIAKSGYRLRTRPSLNGQIVGRTQPGDIGAEPRVKKSRGEWARIQLRGRTAWVHRGAGRLFWTAPTYLNPNRLPSLAAEVAFQEPSGNRRLDADETAEAIVAVTNTGEGPAYRVRASVRPSDGEGIRHEASLGFGTIRPGKTVTRTLRLRARRSLEERTETLTFAFREANGFEPSPVRLAFDTRRFHPPRLVVDDVGIDDAGHDGQISAGELVAVTARIRNVGSGPAKDVAATVRLGENVFQGPDFTRTTQIGALPPGAHHDLRFELVTNRRATEAPVFVNLTESYGAFGRSDLRLPLPFDTPIETLETVRVQPARQGTASAPAGTPLSADIGRNLPETDMQKPDAVAVVVGIRDYFDPDVPSVAFAKRDATLMRRYLTEVMGYTPSNILPRTPDRPMTAGAFKTLIRRTLPGYLRKGSDVFVYFSGHGAPSTGDDPHAYLVPADADPSVVSDDNAYRLSQFYGDLVAAAEAENAGSLTVVLDACFTGQSGDGEMLIRQASPLTLTVENPILAYKQGTSLTASGPGQLASWHPQMQHGLFTYVFLKGLQGAADADGNGRITVAEMERHLTDAQDGVPHWARRLHDREQVPQVQTRDSTRVLVRLE